MISVVTLVSFYFIVDMSYSWTSMGDGGMAGVTYASGTIYNVGTMCPNNVNQGYVCDGRNFGEKYLNPDTVSAFCSGYTGTSKQYGFGHGVTATQKCGECAQIRVPRLDGTYNYMNVMMVDHFTWSMEVGTTEIAYLVEGTNWVVGDRADFDFRIVSDCYASFGDDASTGTGSTSSTSSTSTTTTTTTTTTSTSSSGGSSGGSSGCGVSSNWGDAMRINPYWGSSTYSLYAIIYNPVATFTADAKFEIKGYGQTDSQYQQCVYQNLNSFQCDFGGNPLTEPASVRLTADDGGIYYGINIIESLTGSTAMYPLSACSSTCSGCAEYDDEDMEHKGSMHWISKVAVIVVCLMVIGCIIAGGFCLYRRRKKKGNAYFEDTAGAKVDEADEEDDIEVIEDGHTADITTGGMENNDESPLNIE